MTASRTTDAAETELEDAFVEAAHAFFGGTSLDELALWKRAERDSAGVLKAGVEWFGCAVQPVDRREKRESQKEYAEGLFESLEEFWGIVQGKRQLVEDAAAEYAKYAETMDELIREGEAADAVFTSGELGEVADSVKTEAAVSPIRAMVAVVGPLDDQIAMLVDALVGAKRTGADGDVVIPWFVMRGEEDGLFVVRSGDVATARDTLAAGRNDDWVEVETLAEGDTGFGVRFVAESTMLPAGVVLVETVGFGGEHGSIASLDALLPVVTGVVCVVGGAELSKNVVDALREMKKHGRNDGRLLVINGDEASMNGEAVHDARSRMRRDVALRCGSKKALYMACKVEWMVRGVETRLFGDTPMIVMQAVMDLYVRLFAFELGDVIDARPKAIEVLCAVVKWDEKGRQTSEVETSKLAVRGRVMEVAPIVVRFRDAAATMLVAGADGATQSEKADGTQSVAKFPMSGELFLQFCEAVQVEAEAQLAGISRDRFVADDTEVGVEANQKLEAAFVKRCVMAGVEAAMEDGKKQIDVEVMRATLAELGIDLEADTSGGEGPSSDASHSTGTGAAATDVDVDMNVDKQVYARVQSVFDERWELQAEDVVNQDVELSNPLSNVELVVGAIVEIFDNEWFAGVCNDVLAVWLKEEHDIAVVVNQVATACEKDIARREQIATMYDSAAFRNVVASLGTKLGEVAHAVAGSSAMCGGAAKAKGVLELADKLQAGVWGACNAHTKAQRDEHLAKVQRMLVSKERNATSGDLRKLCRGFHVVWACPVDGLAQAELATQVSSTSGRDSVPIYLGFELDGWVELRFSTRQTERDVVEPRPVIVPCNWSGPYAAIPVAKTMRLPSDGEHVYVRPPAHADRQVVPFGTSVITAVKEPDSVFMFNRASVHLDESATGDVLTVPWSIDVSAALTS